jgi:hypothetical protein
MFAKIPLRAFAEGFVAADLARIRPGTPVGLEFESRLMAAFCMGKKLRRWDHVGGLAGVSNNHGRHRFKLYINANAPNGMEKEGKVATLARLCTVLLSPFADGFCPRVQIVNALFQFIRIRKRFTVGSSAVVTTHPL